MFQDCQSEAIFRQNQLFVRATVRTGERRC